MSVTFDAWLGQDATIKSAGPIYEKTATTINFYVRESDRSAQNLSGYTAKFAAKAVDDEETKFNVSCTITNESGGVCTAALTSTHLDESGDMIGELNLFSGSPSEITERVQFEFSIRPIVSTS